MHCHVFPVQLYRMYPCSRTRAVGKAWSQEAGLEPDQCCSDCLYLTQQMCRVLPCWCQPVLSGTPSHVQSVQVAVYNLLPVHFSILGPAHAPCFSSKSKTTQEAALPRMLGFFPFCGFGCLRGLFLDVKGLFAADIQDIGYWHCFEWSKHQKNQKIERGWL